MTIEKRIERIEAILDARGLDWDHPRVQDDHFAGADKMVAEESPKKWRILEPAEVVQDGDWINARVNLQEDGPPDGGWLPAPSFYFGKEASADFGLFFARLVADEPAKEPEPAWEPRVGDWVRVTRPANWNYWVAPLWQVEMNRFDGRVGQIENQHLYGFTIRGFYGKCGLLFRWHRDWLSPAEPPKPAEPEYREPVLPADCGKQCEFSDDGDDWTEAKLQGYAGCFWISVSSEVVGAKVWEHARIKKDA